MDVLDVEYLLKMLLRHAFVNLSESDSALSFVIAITQDPKTRLGQFGIAVIISGAFKGKGPGGHGPPRQIEGEGRKSQYSPL